MTCASAVSLAFHTGRKKLILSSTVVNVSSSPRVLANAIPIAASATSQRIPPWSVPIGFACFSVASKVAMARPSFASVTRNPMRSATGTLSIAARSKIRAFLRAPFCASVDCSILSSWGFPEKLESKFQAQRKNVHNSISHSAGCRPGRPKISENKQYSEHRIDQRRRNDSRVNLPFEVENKNRNRIDEFFQNRDRHDGSVANWVSCDEYEDHLPQDCDTHKTIIELRMGDRGRRIVANSPKEKI